MVYSEIPKAWKAFRKPGKSPWTSAVGWAMIRGSYLLPAGGGVLRGAGWTVMEAEKTKMRRWMSHMLMAGWALGAGGGGASSASDLAAEFVLCKGPGACTLSAGRRGGNRDVYGPA